MPLDAAPSLSFCPWTRFLLSMDLSLQGAGMFSTPSFGLLKGMVGRRLALHF